MPQFYYRPHSSYRTKCEVTTRGCSAMFVYYMMPSVDVRFGVNSVILFVIADKLTDRRTLPLPFSLPVESESRTCRSVCASGVQLPAGRRLRKARENHYSKWHCPIRNASKNVSSSHCIRKIKVPNCVRMNQNTRFDSARLARGPRRVNRSIAWPKPIRFTSENKQINAEWFRTTAPYTYQHYE